MIPAVPRALALPGLAVVNQELTAEVERRQRVEQELRDRQQELEAANAVEQIAYAASHELREPLRMVVSFLQLLRSPVQFRLHVVTSGEDALEWLRAEDAAQRPRPHLIVLDLNLPGKSGLDVLRELKGDPESSAIPVLIFTSSDAQEDVDSCYRHHANAYVCKPQDIVGYREVTRAIEGFWLSSAQLPAA